MIIQLIINGFLLGLITAIIIPSPGYQTPLAYRAPVLPQIDKLAQVTITEPYDTNPQYSFSYQVHDETTGDIKSQHERRNGDTVEGVYSFIEADGTRRIVHYSADSVNGFNAIVQREPLGVKVAAGPITKIINPTTALLHAGPIIHTKSVFPSLPTYTKTLLPTYPRISAGRVVNTSPYVFPHENSY